MKYLDIRAADGLAVNVEIRQTVFKNRSNADKCLGFAKFIVNEEYHAADMWYIQSNLKGMGSELMKLAQDQLYDRYQVTKIYTDWEASTAGGRKVCLDNGFKRQGELLVWERKQDES